MNKHIFKTLVALVVAMSTLFVACDKEPVAPVDPTQHKLHEDPAKIVYTLIEGTLPEGTNLDEPLSLSALTPTGNEQVYVEEIGSGGVWSRAASSVEHFDVKNTEEHPNVAYALKIEYFNPKGEPMNNQFFDNNQDKIHQHFFVYYEDNRIVREKEQIPHEYAYADTNPFDAEDNAANLVAKTNPLGFKGIIRFVKPGLNYELGVELLHASRSKYIEGITTSPYYAPSRAQRQSDQWDVRRKIPVHVEGESAEDHHHDEEEAEVAKVVLTLAEGHLHGPYYAFHQNTRPAGMKFFHAVQTVTMELVNNKWQFAEGSATQFNVISDIPNNESNIGSGINQSGHYGLWIDYYDAEGHLLNGQIEAESNQHQTLFTASNVKANEWSLGWNTKWAKRHKASREKSIEQMKLQDIWVYHYCDSNPWDQRLKDGAKLSGDKNPIGFKGSIRLLQHDVAFDLNVKLIHFAGSKFKEDGQPREFYNVPLSAHVDVAISVPVVVMFDNSEIENYDYDSEVADQGDLEKYINAAFKACFPGVTDEDVRRECANKAEGDSDPEAGSLWF